MGRCPSLWCNHWGETQLTSHVHLECAWLSNLWIVCRLCDKRAHRMPTLWPSHRISFFKKKNGILWELSLLALEPPLMGKQKTRFHLCMYLHYKLSNGPWNERNGYKVQGIELVGNFTPTHKNGIKQLSIMFQLPYWEVGGHMSFFIVELCMWLCKQWTIM
jgi:hypothetical protein